MSDKYEELVKEYVKTENGYWFANDNDARALMDAFRWYDAKRAAETCECNLTDSGIWTPRFCQFCGRRIVEKEVKDGR